MALNNRGKEISVGAVISLALVVFAVAVMAISKESRLFVPKVRYWTLFENTSGLTEGSPVRLVGLQVGTVEEIRFHDDVSESKIRVEFTVTRNVAPRIREGTLAYLKSLTYLSQDKYIELVPGGAEGPELPPGHYLEPGPSIWRETLRQGQSIADDVKEVTSSLRDFLVAVNSGGGVLQDLVHNPEFGRRGLGHLEESLAALRQVLAGVEQGKGLAGLMLSDEQFARRQMDNIDGALGHLRSAMERIDGEGGVIARLEDPDGDLRQSLNDLRAATASLRKVSEDLEQGRGLIGRLVQDQEFAESLTEKIDAIAGHAASILEKIDRGEGSIGGIINDPTVHEGLKDIVAGVRKSRMGKGFIRHYEKKGAKLREEQEEADPGEETDGSSVDGPNP